ncbi:MAG TPA: HEAT repeat domain-containing protein [Gemmataceae bacterium]|nr:HEAT repeat domain-containing protein [Gemmataceae bacterium]
MVRFLTAFVLLGLMCLCSVVSYASVVDDVADVLKELKSKNAGVRASAAKEVGRLGAVRASDVKDAIPLLLNIIKKDQETSTRKAAIEALGRIDPDPKETVPVLLEALKDKNAPVRQAAAEALGQFPSEASGIIPVLKESEKDKNKMVERAAKMALKNLREQKKE